MRTKADVRQRLRIYDFTPRDRCDNHSERSRVNASHGPKVLSMVSTFAASVSLAIFRSAVDGRTFDGKCMFGDGNGVGERSYCGVETSKCADPSVDFDL
jgi:hypothetical protein